MSLGASNSPSRPGGLVSGRLRVWLLPSFAAIPFFAQMAMIFSRAERILSDPGTGWHLRAGGWMLDHRAVLRADPFSFTCAGREWITFEWLSQVIFAAADRWLGVTGLLGVTLATFGLMGVLLVRWLSRNDVAFPVALLYTLATVAALQPHVLSRPHAFTYLLIVVLLALAGPAAVVNPPSRLSRWLLPLLFAVWANLHGGFVVGFVTWGAVLIGATLDAVAGEKTRSRWPWDWWGLLGLSAVATVVNPNGVRLHRDVLNVLFRLPSLRLWQEFAPTDFYSLGFTGAVWLAIFAVTLALAWRGPRRIPWAEAFPLMVLMYLGLKSQRHVFLLLLVAALPLCRGLHEWLRPWGSRTAWWRRWRDTLRAQVSLKSDWWIIPILTVVCLVAFGRGHDHPIRIGSPHLSDGALRVLTEHADAFRRPFTTTGTGGSVIYCCYPKIRVSFDDRADLYGEDLIRRNLQVLYLQPGWREVWEADGYDSAILSTGDTLVQGLELLPGWRKVYADDKNVLFLRDAAAGGRGAG